ncbi:MAG: AraC family transcriptional regulator ligand-binding domain-containing protein [Myxococcales bacterium]|nr:AraC family transcriptional regulator ligand-binding domain-containing protein [Myxococcales bacterium]
MLNQSDELGSNFVSSCPASFERPRRQAVTAEVSGVLLRALADVAKRYEVEPQALFQGSTQEFMTREPVEVRVPMAEYRALLERAIALTGEPAIGLHCGLYASESAFDLMAPLVAHVPTLRDAIREIRQFQSLLFVGPDIQLSECAGVARLRCEFPRAHGSSDRAIAEFLVAGLLRLLRAFGCGEGDLHAARFQHTTPAYRHLYTTIFEGRECFSDELTALEFPAELLDRPHLHSNPALQALIHSQAEQRLERIARPTRLIDRLRVYLRNQRTARVPDMALAARELGVSVRSLRRRLSEEGISYRTLTQELQRDQACAMLRNADFTLQGVADALGFADTASFHRAFKRWTGLTACEYRNAN